MQNERGIAMGNERLENLAKKLRFNGYEVAEIINYEIKNASMDFFNWIDEIVKLWLEKSNFNYMIPPNLAGIVKMFLK